jgi:DNA replication protein DnaC
MLKFCGMPANGESLTFANFEIRDGVDKAYDGALRLLKRDGEVIFLTIIGEVNKGKTHLGVAVCNAFMDEGIPAKYVFTPTFLDDLRASYNQDAEYSFPQLFSRYCTVPLLMMDDLYRQKPTAWASEKLMQLINARYMAKLSTIFTTNKSFDEICQLDKEQGEAIVSRLQRESWCRAAVIE